MSVRSPLVLAHWRSILAEHRRSGLSITVYHGDGPADGSFVRARMRPHTLMETKPRRKHF